MQTSTIIDTPEGIKNYRLLALKCRLKLETLGLKQSRGFRTAYSIVKEEFALKGNKVSVFNQYIAHLKKIGILQA